MARATRTRLPRAAAPPSYEELRCLYEGTYHQWIEAGGSLCLDKPAPLRRALMLMTDIIPASIEAKRLKAMWALEMLTTKRIQQAPVCEVEEIAMSALLDFIGRQ